MPPVASTRLKSKLTGQSAAAGANSRNTAYVQCSTLSANKNLDPTAKCGAGVKISSDRTVVGRNVLIGPGSTFLYGLRIGDDASLGANIIAGYGVRIDNGACIEDGVTLKDEAHIENGVKVMRRKVGVATAKPKDGFKFVLKNGRCSPM